MATNLRPGFCHPAHPESAPQAGPGPELDGQSAEPGEAGHWFNAINDGGTIKAVDGQSGEIEPWPPSEEGLGFSESEMTASDAIYFRPDGQVVK